MSCNGCLEKSRISSLQSTLQKEAILIEDPIDLYYLTNLTLSAGKLWLSGSEALLLVDGRYIESAGKGSCPAKLLSSQEIKAFLQRNAVQEVVFDGAKTSVARSEELKKTFPEITFTSKPFITRELRLIKDPSEVRLLQKSADMLWEGFMHIRNLLREGISEKELAVAFTVFCLEKGADGLSQSVILTVKRRTSIQRRGRPRCLTYNTLMPTRFLLQM